MADDDPIDPVASGLNAEAIELLTDAAAALNEEIQRLEAHRDYLAAKMGDDRIELLQSLSDQQMDREERFEITSFLSYGERKLLWLWARLTKVKELRREIAHTVMKNNLG
ncbi:MAG: hypothetical protein PHT60_11620 [Acidiphilium sp.]|nr:hypothetical protein [Acidiphilium sp.]MDD4936411.1 hypothetical protein [Acidiphilium sp.]